MSKIPTSLFGRGTKLFGVASRLALNEVSSRLKTWENEAEKIRSKVQLYQDIVKTLSQLKGASMKVGQLLSLDLGDYLPPEVVKVLEQLHQNSTTLPYSEIESILKHELKERFQDFSEITRTPIASASIGQVHRAKLNEKDVIIKIQYPGVAETIPSDLKILEIILKQANFIQGKSLTDLGPFLKEIEEVLIREADYCNELNMHLLYKEKLKNKPYIVPHAYRAYSTDKILTQDFIEGSNFTHWLSSAPSEELKEHFADLLMKLYLEEIFEHGMVQTDPNPGNFIITKDNQLALLDFGAVKEYDSTFVQGYRKVLIASFCKDRETLLKESIDMGFFDPREDQEVQDIYFEMMEFLTAPFRLEEYFDFSDKTFFNSSVELSWRMTKKCKYSPPPKNLIFLHRKLAGIFIFIKKMDVKIRLRDYWHHVQDS